MQINVGNIQEKKNKGHQILQTSNEFSLMIQILERK